MLLVDEVQADTPNREVRHASARRAHGSGQRGEWRKSITMMRNGGDEALRCEWGEVNFQAKAFRTICGFCAIAMCISTSQRTTMSVGFSQQCIPSKDYDDIPSLCKLSEPNSSTAANKPRFLHL